MTQAAGFVDEKHARRTTCVALALAMAPCLATQSSLLPLFRPTCSQQRRSRSAPVCSRLSQKHHLRSVQSAALRRPVLALRRRVGARHASCALLVSASAVEERLSTVKVKERSYNGVFLLILINVVLFVADHWLHVPAVSKLLYLHHAHPHWWQFVTSAFCHGSFEHLNGNLFMLLVFGKTVEQEEGMFGVWLSYLFCGIGASIASFLLLPSSQGGILGASVVSLGASGAVFGLFTISVLVKLSPDWRKMLESLILGSFVVDKVWHEVAVTASGASLGGGINHVAHLSGALCGVLLIVLLTKSLPKDEKEKLTSSQ